MKYRLIISAGLLLAAAGAPAAMISDDFNRADTTQTAYTVNVGGTGWAQPDDGGSTGDDWLIKSNVLRLRNRATDALIYNTGLEMQSGDGMSFTMQAGVLGLQEAVWHGVIFNYTDEDNYYALRIKADNTDYQLLQRTSSGWDVFVNDDLSTGTFAQDTFYTMTISSDTAGKIDFTITEQGNSTVLNSVTSYDDSASALTGGYAGFYGSYGSLTHIAEFDNFELTVVPEPATIGMLGATCAIALFVRRRF